MPKMLRRRSTEPTIIAGDPSSAKLAYVLNDGNSYSILTTRLSGRDIGRRCQQADAYTYQIVKACSGPVFVFIEAPVIGKGGARAAMPLAKVHGAMLAAAWRAGAVEVVPVNISAWKKKIVGSGNAGKPEVATYLRQHWRRMYALAQGEKGFEQDLVDAACIWQYGRWYVGVRKLLSKELGF